MIYLAYAVLFLSLINLIRMAFFLIASELFDLKTKPDQSQDHYFASSYRPLVTVIVPAHNEEKTLLKNLLSIKNSTYRHVELIIANDSSTDKTGAIAKKFQRQYGTHFKKIKVLNLQVRGKALALNKALKYAHGSLFMCLDADSVLAPDSLKQAVKVFRKKSLGALSSNVKIRADKGLLNLIQRIEYLICYQMKKAETLNQIQYIVGGIGSMYRTSVMRKLKFYETNTITEDIDLSMKFIEEFGSKKQIGYEPKMVVFTEAAVSVSDLIKQRFRWKYGRYQVFLKRRSLFWNNQTSKNRFLSWIYLPYALFSELTYAVEPLVIFFIFYLLFSYGDLSMILGSFLTFCFYTIIQVTGASHGYSLKEKVMLSLFAPVAYFLIYILSYVEYLATIRGLLNLRKLFREQSSGTNTCAWSHISRVG